MFETKLTFPSPIATSIILQKKSTVQQHGPDTATMDTLNFILFSFDWLEFAWCKYLHGQES